jgi:CheY-like chemotaxis protein
MEAVGQLTGGIAHDFNNMLTTVIGPLDMLDLTIGENDPRARRFINMALEGARRAAQLTQRLLAFSRQQPLQPVPVDVSQLLGGMSDLLTHSLGSTVNLEIVSIPDVWWAHTDPNQLENAVLNLAVNGRDAMDGGGRLIIHAANCDVRGDEDIRTLGVPEGQYVVIEVSDTGAGMSPDVSARAFDPFFTTKKVGKGTGLGLSQVYGFVKQCAGHVKISAALGRGTSVKIYLPRFLTKVDQATGSLPRSPALQTAHQELIVVVDDEPVVREFSCEALTALGYRVIACEDAVSALDALDQNADVALLFTDVVMPDINGRELADRAWKRNASLKVLFTSGYTRNDALLSGVLSEDVHLLGKPFTVEQLSKKISAILASADALSENQL